jgi:predicted DNA-binding protein
MAMLTLKLPESDAQRLERQARLEGMTKSAYVRSLIRERITTTDDLLALFEDRKGRGLGLRSRDQ